MRTSGKSYVEQGKKNEGLGWGGGGMTREGSRNERQKKRRLTQVQIRPSAREGCEGETASERNREIETREKRERRDKHEKRAHRWKRIRREKRIQRE